ncbi:hypothetical protein GHT06_018474 [Daphnia sinensis]|uniref:Uncharacterized protein n=1 Tax=Daphnia sinensis TaxID=1820382 RepID=A0AAD5L607_9CRUS|nr:hypothetical protein GHT06_018474 [Daphnia sinensis]
MLEGNSVDRLMPNIDSVKSVERYFLPSCSMLKGDSVDQLMPNVDSVYSLGRSCIGGKNKIVRFVQPSGVFVPLSNEEKPVPTSPKKSVRVHVNESIDYEASNYGFEDKSGKRSLKDRSNESFVNVFCRMERESEETCLDLPKLLMQQNIKNPIANLQLSVPLFPP